MRSPGEALLEIHDKTLILPIQLLSKNGRDKLHWRQRNALRKSYEDILSLKYGVQQPPGVKLKATVIRVMGPREREWDSQNIGAGTAVELIDAMTRLGWWQDDRPECLQTAFLQGRPSHIKGPATLVEIEVIREPTP